MPYSCTDCCATVTDADTDFTEPTENPYTCEGCGHPVCFDCKNMDEAGCDFCSRCV